MKYHSPFSVIIISLIVLILFASVALFAVFSIGMTSPTLMAAERIMDELEASGSPVGIKFDSIDRDFRGGVTINGFSASYDGADLISLERIRIHMGIIELVKYALTGSGNLEIEGTDGFISVPVLPTSGGGSGESASLPSFLLEHDISLHLHQIDFSGMGASSENSDLSIYLENGSARAEMFLPLFKFANGDTEIAASNLIVSADTLSGISLSASSDSISGSVLGADFEIVRPILRASVPSFSDYSEAEAALSISSAEGSWNGISFALSRSSVSGTRQDAEAVFLSPCIEGNGYSVSGEEIDLSYDGERVLALLSSFSAEKDGIVIYSAENTELSAGIENESFSLSIPSFTSDALNLLGPDFTIAGDGLRVRGDRDSFWAQGSLSAVNESSALNGLGGDFMVSGNFDGKSISRARVALSSVVIPGLENSGFASATYTSGEELVFRGSFGSRLVFSGNIGEGVDLNAFYTNLPLRPFLPFVSQYVPVLYNYIGDNTAATGSVSVNLASDYTGPMDFALAISDIAFNDLFFSLAASGSGNLEKDGVDISQLSITSDFIRASFSGSINFRTNLPEGRFVVSMTDSGYELFVGTLTLESDEEYYFSAEIPYFSSSWLRGNVNWSDVKVIESLATLKSGDYFYPFDIKIDLNENRVSLENERAEALVDFGENIVGSLSFEHFELPVFRDEDMAPTYLDGTLNASFDFAEQQFRISSESFVIGSIGILPHSPDLDFSLHGDNNSLSFDDISFTSTAFVPLEGRMEIVYGTPSIAMSFSSSESESLILSILRSSDGMFSGLLRMDSFNLERFGIDGMIGNINLTARAGTWDALSFSGSLNAYSRDMINNPVSAVADMYIDSDEIALSSISFSSGNLALSSEEVRYSSETGVLSADVSLSAAIERADGLLPVTTSLSISAALPKGDNIADSVREMISTKLDSSTLSVSIGSTNLGNMFTLGERSLHAINNKGVVELSGNLLAGFVDIASRTGSLYVDLMPVAAFMVDGSFGDSTELRFSIDSLEISIADLFLNPSIVFYAPAPAKGEIVAVGENGTWNLFGWLSAEEVAFDVFWMPGERVILHNPYFSVWDSSFASLIDDCTVLDLETYERTPGRVALTIDLGPSLSMDGWAVDVYADEDNWIGIRLPLTSSNVDIWGDVNGYLRVGEGSDSVLFMNGDLNAANLTMSLGMEPMPEWMTTSSSSVAGTTADLTLLLTENVKFVFPLTGDPILRADIAENQNLRVRVDETGALDVSGSLDIRSGELFYFQKNFYITEGNISFLQDLLEGPGFNPVINLRARLRDFDSNGNPVDIFLILRNSTLDNLSPSFESSPSKPLSEIMQILGQSILPNSIYGDISFSSMVSLVSASVDILSRIGIISTENDSTLEQSIRSSLSLDTFSLHTNVIENLIFDTVSYASSNLDNEALSPMARYLDGTTLYLGKYLSPQLYLEGMVHLDAENNRTETSHTFLADDLNLDIEVSLEWNNPMAVFTIFTQPENITLYDIIDAFGFGFSKRIVW